MQVAHDVLNCRLRERVWLLKCTLPTGIQPNVTGSSHALFTEDARHTARGVT